MLCHAILICYAFYTNYNVWLQCPTVSGTNYVNVQYKYVSNIFSALEVEYNMKVFFLNIEQLIQKNNNIL